MSMQILHVLSGMNRTDTETWLSNCGERKQCIM